MEKRAESSCGLGTNSAVFGAFIRGQQQSMLADVYVVSLESSISRAITDEFPGARLQEAIDLRDSDPQQMYRQGLVTRTGAQDMLEGKRRHRDLSPGAVGLHWSVHAALARGDGAILLLEDDCLPYKGIAADVEELMRYSERFDVAVFDPTALAVKPLPCEGLPGCGWLRSPFWSTLCVLYSATGRKKCLKAFAEPPSVQIDGLLSQLVLFDEILLLCVQRGKLRTSRWLWESNIQEGLRTDDPLGDLQRVSLRFPGVSSTEDLRISKPPEFIYLLLLSLIVGGCAIVFVVEMIKRMR